LTIDRDIWLTRLLRVAEPVLAAAAEGRLRAALPTGPPSVWSDVAAVNHAEALARVLAGIGPWLECKVTDPVEAAAQQRLGLAVAPALASLADAAASDYVPLGAHRQGLVVGGMLALAILRAPRACWNGLQSETRRGLIVQLAECQRISPLANNWQLFSGAIEVLLHKLGTANAIGVAMSRLERMESWYLGDGWYGDGPEFRTDYYNSFVIHPFILACHAGLGTAIPRDRATVAILRAQRHAEVLERMIGADGSMPVLGRSMAYRCANLHLLGLLALAGLLPRTLAAGQARGAMQRVILRTLDAPGTFDQAGWLVPGLAGDQPGLAEPYISCGSLYMCSLAFLPLGLPPEAPFWQEPEIAGTASRAWAGIDLRADHALRASPPRLLP
jgi:hypothetical protein